MDLQGDLIAYYEAEAAGGLRVEHARAMRFELRSAFAEVLTAGGVRTLLDVGAGPGLDTELWQADGFGVVGLDLAHGNVVRMRERGLRAVTGSLFELPFRSEVFGALWTMSTFVHVPHDRFDDAMRELLRVVVPGAPLGIGTWGGRDFEGVVEFGELRPHRFFSLAAHDRWREMLARHATVDAFRTVEASKPDGWEYQFAVVRAPG
jgi:SAM-dependent methyltransferase